MGFGGGSFDSGGGGDFGGSFDSYSSSSDSYGGSGEGGDCKKEEVVLFFAAFFMVAFVASCCFLPAWPPTELNYCVNGASLNPKEQMWCTPNVTSTVRTDSFSSSSISVYRLLKTELPKTILRPDKQVNSLSIYSNSYKYYSFVMMPEGQVSGTVRSTDNTDKCYFMDHENFVKFTKQRSFKTIDKGSGYLSISFTATVADNYYFVVYHPDSGSVTADFDLSFNYSVYDMSGFKPDPCTSKGNCEFDKVGTDEIIIADNTALIEREFHLLLPDKVIVSLAVFFIALVVVFALLTIGFAALCVYLTHFANKKPTEEEGIPLMEEEKTPGSSAEVSSTENTDITVENVPSIPSVDEDLPPYSA